MLPINQVFADRVAPMHRTTLPAEGIVLVKQMKLALKLNQTMGIIHPTHRWLKMIIFPPWMLRNFSFVYGNMLFYLLNLFLVPLRVETQNITQ